MIPHTECGCHRAPTRRSILQGGLATTVLAAGAQSAMAQGAGSPAAAGVRAVDTHAHYFPQPYLDLLGREGPQFKYEAVIGEETFTIKSPWFSPGPLPKNFIDIKHRLADMDAQGISIQALSLTQPMVYLPDSDLSHRLARAWNDAAVTAHKANPDRFVVLVTLPMLDADRAVDELERVSRLPGVRGVYMGTNIDNRDLDDAAFAPIFARIEQLGFPIFLHPIQILGGKRLQSFYLGNLLGNPIETAVAACRLIFGGVLDRHPNLHVNLPHAGGALPILIGRIDHGWKVRKEAKNLPHAPSSYLRRFTYDTISHSKPILEFVISQVGADRIMVGSDYCFDMGYQRPVEIVDELRLSPEERKMILGGTAAKILKI